MRATIGLLEGGFRVLYSNLAPGSPLIPHNFDEATGTRCFTKFIPKTKGIEPKPPVLTSSSSYPRLLREASLPNPGRAAEKLPVGHAHATMTVAGEPTIYTYVHPGLAPDSLRLRVGFAGFAVSRIVVHEGLLVAGTRP